MGQAGVGGGAGVSSVASSLPRDRIDGRDATHPRGL